MARPPVPPVYEVTFDEFCVALALQKYMNPDSDRREVGGLTEDQWRQVWGKIDKRSQTVAFLILGVGLTWKQTAAEMGFSNLTYCMGRVRQAIMRVMKQEQLATCQH